MELHPKPGQPTKYNPGIHPQIAKTLCEAGVTIAELADALGVSDDTIWRWKKKYPEFCGAIEGGRDVADERVKESLYELCRGWKDHPPDYRAIRLWLVNRKPKEWRDVQRTEFSGEVTTTQALPVLEIADLLKGMKLSEKTIEEIRDRYLDAVVPEGKEVE